MFSLRFFGSFSSQRREFLAADDFAPIPLHPAVERQLALLSRSDAARPISFTGAPALFRHVLGGMRELIVEIILWNAVAALIVLGSVVVTRELVRDTSTFNTSLFLAGIYLALRVVQAAVDYTNNLRRLQVHRGVQTSLYRLINDKLLRIDPTTRQAFNKGQLKTLVGSDVESIEDFISAALHQWTTTVVSTALLTPALLIVSGWLGFVALLAAVLLVPIAILGARFIEKYQKLVQESQDSLTTLVGEWVKNIRLVRFLGWPAAIESEVVHRMRKTMVLGAIRHFVVIVVFGISFSWPMIPLLVLFALSAVQSTPLGLVEIFSTYWILDHLLAQIQHIPHSLSLYGSAAAGAERLIELVNAPDLERFIVPAPASAPAISGIPLRIVLEDVSVRYDDATALDHVSVTLDLRARTAIVGSVGSGKTTLVELLVGERHPTSGEVRVEFESASGSLWRDDIYTRFRSAVAYSPQQPFLSNGAMRYNIDLSGTSSAEDLEAATLASQLKPDILLLPRLYDEEVGESGINLSGGQKQRVSLARAFLSKRKILVLDDPLSAVDTKTEGALMKAILEESEGLVLVSHRLDELDSCDRVIVLDAGRIVEDGTPADLARNPSSRFSAFLRAVEDHHVG